MPAESSTPSHSPLFCFCLPVHVRDWCGTPTVPKRTPSCHDSCPIQAEQSLYNVYKNRFLPDLRLVLPPFHFLSAPFPSSFRSSFSCSSFFFFYSLCLCPLHFTMFLFLLLFRASWTFAVPPFSKTYKTSSSPKRDFHVRYTLYIVSTRPRPCPKLKRRNNPGPLHVGYRIRALYLREQDTCQLASSSYVVVVFSPCTCFRVHLPSLLCYSVPRSFFLFVSCFFSSLSYSTSLSPLCPSLAKVNGQWHGGKMGTPACDADSDYTHYIYIYIRVQIRGEELCRWFW